MAKVIAAPGPVSYPFIVSGKVELVLDKTTGNADAVADSIVSLIRRGLKIHYGALRGVAAVYPGLDTPIAVWRRGSAFDVLTRALLELYGVKGEVVYYEDFSEGMDLLRSGRVKAIATSSAIVKGIKIEDLFKAKGVEMPASCGISIQNLEKREEVVNAYLEGIERLRQDPEGSAERIASVVQRKKEFVLGVIKSAELTLYELKDYSAFEALVRKRL